ncbi:melanophilin a isoform X2 [Denticeps clupeoides]|uniref:melanophilin a isoform X2 n=1 Tax=Denticeps clupeoides TaxID=299321 RepID=UPI0010A5143E|nr:melanophilin-like isoform X2 [Denticeps clupeoides]
MDKTLDLSKLTDDEAKHVWEVIQRDFDLRKKEEERLGELKTKIEKEDTKRELLSSQSCLAETHCIRCLQPFKFLVNSKRQCLDCHLYTCKSCSRYNKKEHGWVCDPCRMSRILKIGTLGWYHDNVRNRFKRFGSAKVMKSLYKRLNGPREDDTMSMPDVRYVHNGHDDDPMDVNEAQRYKVMRKTKRLLSVHPLDFDVDEYGSHSRRQSVQYMQEDRGQRNELEYNAEMYHHYRMNRRKSLDRYTRPDDGLYPEHRMVRTRSLSKINMPMSQRPHYQDTSEEEDAFRFPVYQLPPRRRSRASSQENVSQAPPITELNKRMSAIESLLNRLEEKITIPPEQVPPSSSHQQDAEAEKLRRKLDELMSDRALTSDEDVPKKATQGRGTPGKNGPPTTPKLDQAAMSSSSDEMPTETQKRSTAAALCDITTEVLRTINATESAMTELTHSKPIDRPQLVGTEVRQADDAYRELEENVYLAAGRSYNMEKKLLVLEKNTNNSYSCLTDSELSELEGKLAKAVIEVQNTESEVSDIESKIAALSTSASVRDKFKKKSVNVPQRRKFSQDMNTKPKMGSGFQRKGSINI